MPQGAPTIVLTGPGNRCMGKAAAKLNVSLDCLFIFIVSQTQSLGPGCQWLFVLVEGRLCFLGPRQLH